MRVSRLAIGIGVFGWLLFLSYIVYDYIHYRGMLLYHFIKPDNPFEYFFHLTIIASLIGSQITAYLIQQRKRLLLETMASKERIFNMLNEWRVTLDSLPYGVMLIDRDLNIIRANRYISELSGIPLNELHGHKCYEILHNNKGLLGNCPIKRSILSKSSESTEFYDDVNDRYFIASATPILNNKDEIIAFSHPLIDITDLKKKELSLRDAKDAFFNLLLDIKKAYDSLERLYDDLLLAFSTAIDAKSPWTRGHSERVTSYAITIAREMGLNSYDLKILKTAGLLHDIGKIGTYDVILDKPSRLTDEELSIMMQHPKIGEAILKPIDGFRDVLSIIRSHHERYDGKGYPDGLKGEEIPLLARILFVADSFDSMTSDRPYRPAPGLGYAIEELKRHSGTQFDPDVVKAFLRVIEKDRKMMEVETLR
ncbi:MAG: hypothetical protein Fur0020_10390 [Thermodesulfovibrionia bacterium]